MYCIVISISQLVFISLWTGWGTVCLKHSRYLWSESQDITDLLEMMILVLIAALVGVVYGGGNHTCGCMQGPPGRDGRDGVPGPPGPSSPVVVELQELKKSLITELKQMVGI